MENVNPFFFLFFFCGVSSSNYEYNNETKALVQAFSSTTNKGAGSGRAHQPLFSPFYFFPFKLDMSISCILTQ
jgi:hypothetical protein